MTALLELDGVCFGYHERVVIAGASLKLAAGEIFALLGPNGAGKTTLVKLITGRYQPKAGIIRLLGGDPAAQRRAVGLAPQEIGVYPHLSARENVATFARLAGLPRTAIAAATEAALEAAQLTPRADEPVARLSGGYQRRVNLAAAIAHQPTLLLLDEPVAGVDLEAVEAIEQVIRARARAGCGVLLITHDLEQAQRLADRVGFLLEGRLERQGTPRQLLQQAFGDSRMLRLELVSPPDEGQQRSLRSHGLEPGDDACCWSGRAAESAASLESLRHTLEDDAGIPLRALCLHRPTLASLFQRLTRKPSA